MEHLVNQNGEFFVFIKREFGNRQFSIEALELMFIAYVAGKHGIPKQVPAVFMPIDFEEEGIPTV